jgi:hypothetical protein
MAKHRNPRPKVPKRPIPDNPDSKTGVLIVRAMVVPWLEDPPPPRKKRVRSSAVRLQRQWQPGSIETGSLHEPRRGREMQPQA